MTRRSARDTEKWRDLAAVAHHPLIEGLRQMLPATPPFSRADRERWLVAAKANLELVYGSLPEEDPERPVGTKTPVLSEKKEGTKS